MEMTLEKPPSISGAVAKWRCHVDGWGIDTYLEPEKGWSKGFPARELTVNGRTILYHFVSRYPHEKRYILVAGYRKSENYDSGGKRFANVDPVSLQEYASVRRLLADVTPDITNVRFYGEEDADGGGLADV